MFSYRLILSLSGDNSLFAKCGILPDDLQRMNYCYLIHLAYFNFVRPYAYVFFICYTSVHFNKITFGFLPV